MKNYFTLLLFLLLPFVMFSQTNDSITKAMMKMKTDTTKKRKLEIGFSISPDYGYRTLKSDASSKEIKDILDTLEVPKLGFTAGINLAYHLTKNIVIETGVLFSDKGEKTKKTLFANVPSGQLPIYFTYKYNYFYLDIPLKVNYYVSSGKFKLYLTAGVSGDIFLIQKTTLIQGHDNSDWVKTTSTVNPDFNRFNLAVLAGAGFNYQLSDKATLKIEPIYRRSVTSIIDAPIKSYLYSGGLNIGIYYKL